ncbi:hypothetical protein [Granulicella tundricola]|uniref:Uncharacterized protein n=1 Tax=Granulicella tundricola (strain ATCC BAA-1859 / DSM 23138 / MP5ACTX9) TaxID=1198114 RepID=E8X179_GRATM|nr:hypothetical protein [Granulicella tundricola]ADW69033.1 hypothetical protein AciX9_1987 [Granulicella tundricola MP5ACTX9]
MDERTIVSVADEQQAGQVNEVRQHDLRFLAQWKSIEEYPACPVGIGILKQMAEASPGAYELALSKGMDRPDHPLLIRNPHWRAFVAHYQACENCNEV